jgi:hypothetical protein
MQSPNERNSDGPTEFTLVNVRFRRRVPALDARFAFDGARVQGAPDRRVRPGRASDNLSFAL